MALKLARSHTPGQCDTMVCGVPWLFTFGSHGQITNAPLGPCRSTTFAQEAESRGQ